MQIKDKKVATPRKKQDKDKFSEEIVAEVNADFKERQKERTAFDRQWQLNMNFLIGNQYCKINGRGEIDVDDSGFYWQDKEVFNHIAPIIETRLAKFLRIKPSVFVHPKSDDDKDVAGANMAEKLISQSFTKNEIEEVIKKSTVWSETCGTGFYKVVWDNYGGNVIGEVDGDTVYDGEVKILPISPFEVFPDNLYTENLQECGSIIHARAVPVKLIKEKYGVNLIGEDVDVFSLSKTESTINKKYNSSSIHDAVIVIERYEKPCTDFPNGRLITVAGDKLLYYGELPYLNGNDGSREFPFVKQECIALAGNFFGTSVIERLIPIQRSFNAVKNRKHEFLNRLSLGVVTVEDGAVDVDNLAEEGISPGKIIVYRQGSKAPEMMDDPAMPEGFEAEEDKLINEFVTISGVSDVSSSKTNAHLSSASALKLLVEQDNERIIMSAENIRKAYLEIAKHVIRLFAQFTGGLKAIKYIDAFRKTKVCYLDKSTLCSDDVYLEEENELLYSDSQKKEMLFKLYDSGLLYDETGKLRPETKEKLLSLLGYKDLDYQKGISRLQEEKTERENEILRTKDLSVEEIDDDGIHIDGHTKYVLCEYSELDEKTKLRFYNHIKAHKERLNKKNKEN